MKVEDQINASESFSSNNFNNFILDLNQGIMDSTSHK